MGAHDVSIPLTDDLAPGDLHQLAMLAGEPCGETVRPDAEHDAGDRAGEEYERATDEEAEELIQEVPNDD